MSDVQQTRRLTLRDNQTAQGLLLTTLLLLVAGSIMVPSALASVKPAGALLARASVRHILFAVLAACVLFTAWRCDYRRFLAGPRFPIVATATLGVALLCGLLVFVPGIGRSVGGYHRWIRIGPGEYSIGFQPSELIKLTMVIFLAAWLSRRGNDVISFRRTFLPAVGVIVVCLAVVIRNDFGTAVIIAAVGGVTMLLAGVRWYYVAALGAWGGGILFAILSSDPVRWRRIEAMLDPMNSANPSAYQLRQSLTTISSGGWAGKGLGLGMMKHGFLPEDSTDFLFATLCEEWGFIGSAVVLVLLAMWLIFACRAAMRAGDRFGQVLAGSLGFLIAMQAVMHIAVNVGCLPPTGIAMPLVSAGGTSLVLMAAATALIISVSARACELEPPIPRPIAVL